jgi:hypothetical protein
MQQAAGDAMGRAPSWNRTRAAAILTTLLLHGFIGFWWLQSWSVRRIERVAEDRLIWLPAPDAAPVPPPPPLAPDTLPPIIAPIAAPPLSVPEITPAPYPDWSATARDVAKGMTTAPTYPSFGEVPKGPQQRPKERLPPSIWPKPLPRVGTTVTTDEGETIIWVSDYCYVSISSRSLTRKEIHDSRKGVRTCILAQFGGEKKPRDDLFDAIKRPPPPQEPGCNEEGVGQSCAR